MKKRQLFRKELGPKKQTAEIYTVGSRKPVRCRLVNLSAGGVAVQLSFQAIKMLALREGDIVYVNLKSLGIGSGGICSKIVRLSQVEDKVELGVHFVSASEELKGQVDALIGWSQLKSSLKRPRTQAAEIYTGEEGPELPRWLSSLLSLGRSSQQYMRLDSPLKPKAHLVEWIEESVDREQLGISLTQSL